MNYSETNVSNMRGVLPFMPWEDLYLYGQIKNDTQTIYTIEMHDYLYITYMTYAYKMDDGQSGGFWCWIEDSGNIPRRMLFERYVGISGRGGAAIPVYFPLEANGTFLIKIYSSTFCDLRYSLNCHIHRDAWE